jgi:gluconolactonase
VTRFALAIVPAAALIAAAYAQTFTELKFERLAVGYRFTEGPAWSKDGYLVFSDTPSDRLMKWTPGSAVEVFRTDAHGPAGNAFDPQGRLYTCETRTRRVTRTDKAGKIETVIDRWDGKRLNAPTGIATSKNGSVYFTDPAFGSQSDQRELDFYGVYHIPVKGNVSLVAKYTTRPRGIAVSPNARTLYVADSDAKTIHAFDLDSKGEASNDRVLVAKVDGIPGGIAVDEKGNLWVAANGLNIYGPDGKKVHAIEMHEVVSACAFGEPDMKTLFLTSRGQVTRARQEGQ